MAETQVIKVRLVTLEQRVLLVRLVAQATQAILGTQATTVPLVMVVLLVMAMLVQLGTLVGKVLVAAVAAVAAAVAAGLTAVVVGEGGASGRAPRGREGIPTPASNGQSRQGPWRVCKRGLRLDRCLRFREAGALVTRACILTAMTCNVIAARSHRRRDCRPVGKPARSSA